MSVGFTLQMGQRPSFDPHTISPLLGIQSSYTVQKTQEGVVLVFGSIPASDVKALSTLVPRNAYMSSHLSNYVNATMALGAMKALDACLERLTKGPFGEHRATAIRQSNRDVPENAVRWLVDGKVGRSSMNLFSSRYGYCNHGYSAYGAGIETPRDWQDFELCAGLVHADPSCRPVPGVGIAQTSEAWNQIALNWDQLVDQLRNGAESRQSLTTYLREIERAGQASSETNSTLESDVKPGAPRER